MLSIGKFVLVGEEEPSVEEPILEKEKTLFDVIEDGQVQHVRDICRVKQYIIFNTLKVMGAAVVATALSIGAIVLLLLVV